MANADDRKRSWWASPPVSSIIGGVAVAAIIAVADWASKGGLVGVFNGVTQEQFGHLEERLRDLQEDVAMPRGVVIASTVNCLSLGAGWSPYDKAAGLFVVGVGGKDKYIPEDTGGNRALTVPAHNHAVPIYVAAADRQIGWGFVDNKDDVPVRRVTTATGTTPPSGSRSLSELMATSMAGTTAEIDIIPPYIALYWCIKEN